MARNSGRLTSQLLCLDDATVAMAVDLAATWKLADYDAKESRAAQYEALALAFGGGSKGRGRRLKIEERGAWDSVEEF